MPSGPPPRSENGPDPRRSQPRGAATRERLLAAANGLFAERGYEGTSIGDVARQAGVGVGTVYHHFTDKRALLLVLLERNEGTRLEDETGGPMVAAFEVEDVRGAFMAITRLVVQLRREHPSVFPIGLDLARRDEEVAQVCARIQTHHRAQIRRDIEAGQKLGKVRPEIDVEAAALLLNQLFEGGISRVAQEPPGEASEPLIIEMTDLVCGYLLVR
jgi:AcrR family transcriptional regulator